MVRQAQNGRIKTQLESCLPSPMIAQRLENLKHFGLIGFPYAVFFFLIMKEYHSLDKSTPWSVLQDGCWMCISLKHHISCKCVLTNKTTNIAALMTLAISGARFTFFPKCFSPFAHATCSLSVSRTYLAFGGAYLPIPLKKGHSSSNAKELDSSTIKRIPPSSSKKIFFPL